MNFPVKSFKLIRANFSELPSWNFKFGGTQLHRTPQLKFQVWKDPTSPNSPIEVPTLEAQLHWTPQLKFQNYKGPTSPNSSVETLNLEGTSFTKFSSCFFWGRAQLHRILQLIFFGEDPTSLNFPIDFFLERPNLSSSCFFGTTELHGILQLIFFLEGYKPLDLANSIVVCAFHNFSRLRTQFKDSNSNCFWWTDPWFFFINPVHLDDLLLQKTEQKK